MDRKDRVGGGVLLYIKNYLKPTRLECHTNNNKVETVWAQIRGENNQLVNTGVVYRSPDQRADIDDIMYGELNYQIARHQPTVIMGDFNLRSINWNNIDVRSYYTERNRGGRALRQTSSEKLIELMQENFLIQSVKEPTRQDSILDLVLSTDENLVQNLKVGEHIATSDHNIIRGEINIAKKLEENNEKIYNYKRGNFNQIREKLGRIDWDHLFRNKTASDMYDIFTTKLMKLVDRYVPKQTRRTSGKVQPKWFTREIKQVLIQKKSISKINGQTTQTRPRENTSKVGEKCKRKLDKVKGSMRNGLLTHAKKIRNLFTHMLGQKRRQRTRLGHYWTQITI